MSTQSARAAIAEITKRSTTHSGKEQESKPASSPKVSQYSGKVSFKILKFEKLAEVFSGIVSPNSLDNVFVEGEIALYYKDNDSEDITSLLSYKQNKPFDVLLWAAKKAEGAKEDMKFFNPIHDPNCVSDSSVYLWNMKAFCFAYLMVMTRGSFPLKSGGSAENKLPNLLTSRLNMDSNATERDFAEKLSSIDMSKVDCKWMLDLDINQMPDPIRNRITKGTAGSRALKIILAALQIVPIDESHVPEVHLDALAALASVANGGSAYLSLHPAKQQVQSQIQNFYRSCLLIAAEHVGVQHFDELKQNLNKIESFKKDKALQDLVVVGTDFKFGSGTFVNGFHGKTFDQIVKLFGKSL